MNIRKLMNETLVANNGEMSRGLKNQLNMMPIIFDNTLEDKLDLLKKEGISVYNYCGLRVLEFNLNLIEKVLNENKSKLENYRANPQELVRDLREKEIKEYGSGLEADMLGGM
jgi:DNA repair photolyase